MKTRLVPMVMTGFVGTTLNLFLANLRNKVVMLNAEMNSAQACFSIPSLQKRSRNNPSTEFILSEAEGLRTGFGMTAKNHVFLTRLL